MHVCMHTLSDFTREGVERKDIDWNHSYMEAPPWCVSSLLNEKSRNFGEKRGNAEKIQAKSGNTGETWRRMGKLGEK